MAKSQSHTRTVRCTVRVAGSTKERELLPSLRIRDLLSVVIPHPSDKGPAKVLTSSKLRVSYSYSLPLCHTS